LVGGYTQETGKTYCIVHPCDTGREVKYIKEGEIRRRNKDGGRRIVKRRRDAVGWAGNKVTRGDAKLAARNTECCSTCRAMGTWV
jgi:hypothetical protein